MREMAKGDASAAAAAAAAASAADDDAAGGGSSTGGACAGDSGGCLGHSLCHAQQSWHAPGEGRMGVLPASRPTLDLDLSMCNAVSPSLQSRGSSAAAATAAAAAVSASGSSDVPYSGYSSSGLRGCCSCPSPLLSCSGTIPELRTDILKLQLLGSGSTSSVHLAIDLRTLQLLAIKDVAMYAEQGREMFRSEVRALQPQRTPLLGASVEALSSRQCASIVKYYGCVELADQGVARIAVEFVSGGNLQQWVDDGVPAPEPWLASIAHQCLEALDFLHAGGRLHKDIKPANVLVTSTGDVKLADFGLSTDQVGIQRMEGTLRFMAPERLTGKVSTGLSDVWSLGLVLATVAMGRVPVQAARTPFSQLSEADRLVGIVLEAQSLSLDLRDMLAACLRVNVEERAGVQELLAHPFLKHRRAWRAACPEVLRLIMERQHRGIWITPEMIVEELEHARPFTSPSPSFTRQSLHKLAWDLDYPAADVECLFSKAFGATAITGEAPLRLHEEEEEEEVTRHRRHSEASSIACDEDSADEGGGGQREHNHRSLCRSSDSFCDPVALAVRMCANLDLTPHFSSVSLRFVKCFRGCDAVEWMLASGMASSSEHAVEIGNLMVDAGAVFHVNSDHVFQNDRLSYQFSPRVLAEASDLQPLLHRTWPIGGTRQRRRFAEEAEPPARKYLERDPTPTSRWGTEQPTLACPEGVPDLHVPAREQDLRHGAPACLPAASSTTRGVRRLLHRIRPKSGAFFSRFSKNRQPSSAHSVS